MSRTSSLCAPVAQQRPVQGYLDDGYLRTKLKIATGWDLEPLRAVRERFGDELQLQVDRR